MSFIGIVSWVAGGVVLGVMGNSAYAALGWSLGRFINPLKIDHPGAGDVLKDPFEFSPGCVSYRITGTLGSLPKNHHIWLLVQLPASSQIRPQGFASGKVDYKSNGRWEGRVFPRPSDGKKAVIIAVVAPPAVHALFNYYQRVGYQTNWEPLDDIPQECRKRFTVQAELP